MSESSGHAVVDPQRFALIGAALSWEIDAVLQALSGCGEVRRVDRTWWRGDAGAVAIAVYRTGVGVGAARRATRRILRHLSASLIVNTGCAGALDAGWAPGDLAAATAIVAAPQRGAIRQIDRHVRDVICELANSHLPEGRRVRPAILLTAPFPLLTAVEKARCAAACDAQVVDMEGAGVGEVAAVASLPFVSVRAILDPLDSDLPALAIPRRRRDALAAEAGDDSFSPAEIQRAAALHAHTRAARRSLIDFHEALFGAMQEGMIDRDLDGLR